MKDNFLALIFLFSITKQSITLLGKSTNVDDCIKAVTLCIGSLKKHHTLEV